MSYVRDHEYSLVPTDFDYINKRLNDLEARIDKLESDLMDRMNFEDSDDEEYPIDVSMLNELAIKFHHADPLVTAALPSFDRKSIFLINNEYGINYLLYEIVLQEFNWNNLDNVLERVEKMAKENPNRRHKLRLMVE